MTSTPWSLAVPRPAYRHFDDQPMTGDQRSRADLTRQLLRPRSIAIVGASGDLSRINGRPLKHLLEKGYTGRILPVNPKYGQIAGLDCVPAISLLPEAADLAIVAVPAREVLGSLNELGQRGVRAAVVFSSGFGEMGDDGRQLEAQLLACARSHGMVLCGPNCLGFINAFDNVYATFSQYADGPTGAGPIAFVTQSGAFGTAIAALARRRGLGLGYFINTGNQADLDFSELMMSVIDDTRIRVAAGYLEGVRDGRALVDLARRCAELGKPLVLTKVGRKVSGQRAAASHTGSLAVADTVFDAVIRQYGVLRARNEEQMLDMLQALSQTRSCAGNGLGIATQSGGAGVMMADRAEEVGLRVPELADDTRTRLAQVMPAFGAIGNPVDVTGEFVARPELLSESVVALLDDPGVDVGVIWLQLMTAHVDKLVQIFCNIRDRSTKPFFVCWVAAPPEAIERLLAEGIVSFSAGERAVEAAAALARHGAFVRRARDRANSAGDQSLAAPLTSGGMIRWGVQPSVEAVAGLQAAGVPMVPVTLARHEDEAVAQWRALGCSVAMKIESPDITHKTDIGGVVLGLDEEQAVRGAFRQLMRQVGQAMPHARMDGIVVQAMTAGSLELVVGARRDPNFGMVIMVGLGGVLVEVLKDVSFRHAPFDVEEALSMLDDLRASAVLDGVRGQPAVNRLAIAQLLSRLSRWADAMSPWLAELDLNPVIVGASGPCAVDCVMVFRSPEEDAASGPSRAEP